MGLVGAQHIPFGSEQFQFQGCGRLGVVDVLIATSAQGHCFLAWVDLQTCFGGACHTFVLGRTLCGSQRSSCLVEEGRETKRGREAKDSMHHHRGWRLLRCEPGGGRRAWCSCASSWSCMCGNFAPLCNCAVDSVPRPVWRGAGLTYCALRDTLLATASAHNTWCSGLALLCVELTAHQITLLCHGATQETRDCSCSRQS